VSNTQRVHRWEAAVTLQGQPAKAMADQIRTVAKARLTDYIDTLAVVDLLTVERAIKVQLDLN